MIRTGLALILLAMAASVSGCATHGLTADDAAKMVGALHAAGCGGQISVHLGASTGQLGGQAAGSLDASGECPKGAVPPAPPITAATDAPAA